MKYCQGVENVLFKTGKDGRQNDNGKGNTEIWTWVVQGKTKNKSEKLMTFKGFIHWRI